MMRVLTWLGLWALMVTLAGCPGGDPKGGHHQPCYGDGSCDEGLVCDPIPVQCVDPAEDCAQRECGPSPTFGHDCGTCQGDREVCTPLGECLTAWEPRFDPLVDALLNDLATNEAYGVSVAVMEGGELTFVQAFGSKDPAGTVPLTPETLMQIGSTTKQMTAVALLRNVEAGQVGLDDTLEQVLPELEFALDPTWDDRISLHHLLTHQGAFYDWLPWDSPTDDGDLAAYTYGTYADQFFLMAPPGEFWNYSNPNFSIAGLISEVLDDRAWSDIMRQDVFEPLGMDRTYLRKTEVLADGDFALSYGIGTNDLETFMMGPVEMEDMGDPAWGRPAGLVWTTPTQMMIWATFLMEGDPDVLSDALRTELNSAQVPLRIPTGDQRYGYGQFVHTGYLALDGTWYETPVWEHGGATMSFSHFFYVLPEADFAIAICASGFVVDFFASADTAITTLADLPAPSPAPPVVFNPDQLDRHVGSYHDGYNVGRMVITRVGDGLRISMPDLEAAGYRIGSDLEAISSDYHIATIGGQQFDLTFIPENPGGPSQYVRNRLFVTARSGRNASPWAVDPARIERLLERAKREPIPLRPLP